MSFALSAVEAEMLSAIHEGRGLRDWPMGASVDATRDSLFMAVFLKEDEDKLAGCSLTGAGIAALEEYKEAVAFCAPEEKQDDGWRTVMQAARDLVDAGNALKEMAAIASGAWSVPLLHHATAIRLEAVRRYEATMGDFFAKANRR